MSFSRLDCLICSLVDGSALLPVFLAIRNSLLTVSMIESEDSTNNAIRKHKDIKKSQEILTVNHGSLLLLGYNN